jgi:hypothetical protein
MVLDAGGQVLDFRLLSLWFVPIVDVARAKKNGGIAASVF